MDFRQYYHLESYLLDTVQPRFRNQGYLLAFDFFCIVIWKANRAKSHVARKLLNQGHRTLNGAAKALTIGLILPFATVGQKAIMADPHKGLRKHMEQEPTDELLGT